LANNRPADFSMPEVSEQQLAAFHRVMHEAAAFAASIQRDETGDIIGDHFTGNGNGGNISRESLIAKSRLQLSLNALTISSKEG